MCTVLVTGLGGLYSLLPNTIEIATADWHRITSDDVAEIDELTAFMNALEFCNAVVQVAHELIREQLLDVMYLGFIVPVLGPALLQVIATQRMDGRTGCVGGGGGGFLFKLFYVFFNVPKLIAPKCQRCYIFVVVLLTPNPILLTTYAKPPHTPRRRLSHSVCSRHSKRIICRITQSRRYPRWPTST